MWKKKYKYFTELLWIVLKIRSFPWNKLGGGFRWWWIDASAKTRWEGSEMIAQNACKSVWFHCRRIEIWFNYTHSITMILVNRAWWIFSYFFKFNIKIKKICYEFHSGRSWFRKKCVCSKRVTFHNELWNRCVMSVEMIFSVLAFLPHASAHAFVELISMRSVKYFWIYRLHIYNIRDVYVERFLFGNSNWNAGEWE